MNQQYKDAIIKQLRHSKVLVERVREDLVNKPDAGEARKELLDAEFAILRGIHKISWIGEKHKEKEEKEHKEEHDDKLLQDKT